MAGAGQIILNTARRPFVVSPQQSIFREPRGSGGGANDALQGINGVMALMKNAKGIADAVAPYLGSGNKGKAEQVYADRSALDAIETVRAAKQAQNTVLPQVPVMPQGLPDAQGLQAPTQALVSPQSPMSLGAQQDPMTGRLPGSQSLRLSPEASVLANPGIQQPGSQFDEAAAQAITARASQGARLFTTQAEAIAALKDAAAKGDGAAYMDATARIAESPFTDVRPKTMADYVTGAHVERARIAAIRSVTMPGIKTKAIVKDYESKAADRVAKQLAKLDEIQLKKIMNESTIDLNVTKGALNDSRTKKTDLEAGEVVATAKSQRRLRAAQANSNNANAAYKRDLTDFNKKSKKTRLGQLLNNMHKSMPDTIDGRNEIKNAQKILEIETRGTNAMKAIRERAKLGAYEKQGGSKGFSSTMYRATVRRRNQLLDNMNKALTAKAAAMVKATNSGKILDMDASTKSKTNAEAMVVASTRSYELNAKLLEKVTKKLEEIAGSDSQEKPKKSAAESDAAALSKALKE